MTKHAPQHTKTTDTTNLNAGESQERKEEPREEEQSDEQNREYEEVSGDRPDGTHPHRMVELAEIDCHTCVLSRRADKRTGERRDEQVESRFRTAFITWVATCWQ